MTHIARIQIVSVKRMMIKLAVLSGMLMGLPLTGILIWDFPLTRYMAFPPEARYVVQAPFSWTAFACYGFFVAAVGIGLLLPVIQRRSTRSPAPASNRPFPWWGWASLMANILFWVLAWSRFPFVRHFQAHTFFPLWVSFIVFLNALSFRRTGRCMLTHKTGLFLALFPLSAAFWWFFEYLNRFVQNWYYVGARFSPLEYFIYASLSFSTVLPAVAGMREWLSSYGWPTTCYDGWLKVECQHPRFLAFCTLTAAGTGLALVGVFSDYLFPLLWVSPLLIVISLSVMQGEPHLFSQISDGKWSRIISFSLAALLCGFFWEMWNFFSLAKWNYSIPFVHRFQIFEMPLLGYAGYLPFGLECAVILDILEDLLSPKRP